MISVIIEYNVHLKRNMLTSIETNYVFEIYFRHKILDYAESLNVIIDPFAKKIVIHYVKDKLS